MLKTGAKSGGSPSGRAHRRRMRFRRLSMVEMLRLSLSRRMRSIQTLAASGVTGSPSFCPELRAIFLRTVSTRSCISVAAALVKVMARMPRQSSGSPGPASCSSLILARQASCFTPPGEHFTRSFKNSRVRVYVFPAPADAFIWCIPDMGILRLTAWRRKAFCPPQSICEYVLPESASTDRITERGNRVSGPPCNRRSEEVPLFAEIGLHALEAALAR